jgi:hypothetical protein
MLIVFKFCNYGCVLAKVSMSGFFRMFQLIFFVDELILLFMRFILVVCVFYRTIRPSIAYS